MEASEVILDVLLEVRGNTLKNTVYIPKKFG